ncbi:MAG TPA: polyphosphate kinase 2 family protein [Gemmatimonadaceae bacterium]
MRPTGSLRWSDIDPDDHGDFKTEADAQAKTEAHIAKLDALQERLYAEGRQSLLIVLQALDTGGKDGTIRHVMRGLNPQGCHVTSFKVPTPEERSHDFLWRVHKEVPARGMIGIFNRSHYEDVLVTRVHGDVSPAEAKDRFRAINRFEQQLAENGTTILKFYLAISKAEQRRRLQARVDDPQKRWKFSTGDVAERRHWDAYMKVYADACAATCTPHAPWYPVPANHKWYRNYLVAKIVAATLKKMHPRFPVSRGPSNIRIR